ncbi:DUF1501 domain-containing protein [Planctomicrobium sp. SH664]|uniref:DUF1501 domain-containing protein n=1 Tax=Planctomicrobium sp. SH664 TaxID=3448125 RepID=UPI003F5BA329
MQSSSLSGWSPEESPFSRRRLLQWGSLTALTVAGSPPLLARSLVPAGAQGKEGACILICNRGGPSQLDLFDPKPLAPSEFRGPFRAIPTSVAGLQVSELLPGHARLANRIAVIRSCHHAGPAIHDSLPNETGGAESVDGLAASLPSLDGSATVDLGRMERTDALPAQLQRAWSLTQEPPAVLERYGRTRFGLSCLRARRLIEAGVRFVGVPSFPSIFDESTWDIHGRKPFSTMTSLKNRVAPIYDRAYTALVEDLEARGLLEGTLVAALSEFGRSPRINQDGGRDHWTRCYSVTFAGGGVQGGRVIGASDSCGQEPVERPVSPEELAATIARCVGQASGPRVARPVDELF